MKTKICALCYAESNVMYRIQTAQTLGWLFVCTDCCKKSQQLDNYKYGGTWKGKRH